MLHLGQVHFIQDNEIRLFRVLLCGQDQVQHFGGVIGFIQDVVVSQDPLVVHPVRTDRNKRNPVGLFLITFVPADIIGKNLGDFGFSRP